MKKSWIEGLEKDISDEIRMAFTSSSILRKRLEVILRKKEEENYKLNISKNDYESPNWSFIKADSIGYARALNDIIKLIE